MDTNRHEWRVVITVLAVIVGAELTFRPVQNRLSLDLEHIHSIPKVAEELDQHQGTSILLLGNSYTRRDIHLDVLHDSLVEESLLSPRVAKVRPDSTAVLEWYYLFKTHFIEPGRLPDVVVIGFTAPNHLSDERRIDGRLLGGRFCRLRHLPEVFSHDVTSFEGRVTFLLSRLSAMFSNQAHIRRRALDRIIPHYQAGEQQVNSRLNAKAKAITSAAQPSSCLDCGGSPPPSTTHTRLERFADLLNKSGVKVVFVAMPSPDRPDPHPEALEIMQTRSFPLLDCRNVPGVGPGDFEDVFYLDREAGQVYSRYFGGKLAELLTAVQPAS